MAPWREARRSRPPSPSRRDRGAVRDGRAEATLTRAPSLHHRIRSDIEGRILSGDLKPGDKIPTEAEFMALYGCSRMTVSKALSTLSGAGLLDRRKRAGTIVAARPIETMVLDVPDLPVEIAGRGQAYRFALLARVVRRAVADRADEVRLVGTGRLLHLEGIHYADDRPFAFEERLVSLAAVPRIEDADFAREPPGSWLLHHIPWTEAENRIGVVEAAADWAGRLNVRVGAPCLSIERRTWRGDEELTLVRQKFVAGQFELVARFGRL